LASRKITLGDIVIKPMHKLTVVLEFEEANCFSVYYSHGTPSVLCLWCPRRPWFIYDFKHRPAWHWSHWNGWIDTHISHTAAVAYTGAGDPDAKMPFGKMRDLRRRCSRLDISVRYPKAFSSGVKSFETTDFLQIPAIVSRDIGPQCWPGTACHRAKRCSTHIH